MEFDDIPDAEVCPIGSPSIEEIAEAHADVIAGLRTLEPLVAAATFGGLLTMPDLRHSRTATSTPSATCTSALWMTEVRTHTFQQPAGAECSAAARLHRLAVPRTVQQRGRREDRTRFLAARRKGNHELALTDSRLKPSEPERRWCIISSARSNVEIRADSDRKERSSCVFVFCPRRY